MEEICLFLGTHGIQGVSFLMFDPNPVSELETKTMVFCYQNCSNGKKCSYDREKLLKFEAEGGEFSKILRSLEQFIQTVQSQNKFW